VFLSDVPVDADYLDKFRSILGADGAVKHAQVLVNEEERMIEIDNVSKWYGSFQVLSDCSTQVGRGDVVVVCGPSGSGKSTLIKTVNGLEPFQQGSIRVDGTSVGDPATRLPALRTCRCATI
jgi:ABC-type bacteriocin/lantibiotic exporter with double-glycine peptidase domain